MRVLFVGGLLIGCGNNAITPDTDADTRCPSPSAAMHVSTTALGPVFGSSIEITFPATQAGDLLLLALSHGEPIAPRGGIPQTGASPPGCAGFTSVWSFGNVSGNLTSATISSTPDVPLFAYVTEFAGLSPAAGTTLTAYAAGEYQTQQIAEAPTVEACPGDLVFSTMTTCGAITMLADQSPFVSAAAADSFAAAYYVPNTPGAYGAAWTYDGTGWAGNTLVFR